jgi:quercetin dioxygenase-like cupin family protein
MGFEREERSRDMATVTKLERDPVTLDSKHYKVEAENDAVRVVRIRYGPREKSVMHQHPSGAVVFLEDGEFTFTYPDGRIEPIKAKRGEFIAFEEPWEHLPESKSDKPFEALYIEVKR